MRAFFGNPIVVVFFLMVFPPLGIFFMFHFTDWAMGWKMSLAVISGAIFIIAIIWTMQQEAALLAEQNMMYLFSFLHL